MPVCQVDRLLAALDADLTRLSVAHTYGIAWRLAAFGAGLYQALRFAVIDQICNPRQNIATQKSVI